MGHHPMGSGVDPNPRFLAERLVDPSALVMGNTAENLHDRFPHLTRERADAFAVLSQERTAKAYADGLLQPDLVPVATRSSEQGWGYATADEPPRPGTTVEALAGLRTPFRPHGRVTAGNAAGPERRRHRVPASPPRTSPTSSGCPGAMRLVSFAFAGVEPEVMGVGPVPATEKALAKAGLSIDDIGRFEVNEAFAVQVLAFLDHFGIADDDPRVNPRGGAIAVGHPLASSGVRLMTNLARELEAAPRGPLRPHHDVHRARHGRHGGLGEHRVGGRPMSGARRDDGAGRPARRGRHAGARAAASSCRTAPVPRRW